MKRFTKTYFCRQGSLVLVQIFPSRIQGIELEVKFLATFNLNRGVLDETSDHPLARYLRKALFDYLGKEREADVVIRFRLQGNCLRIGMPQDQGMGGLIERIIEILFAWQAQSEAEAILQARKLLEKAGIEA